MEIDVPRGVAIPELREQLFQAAERLLVRDGPSGLSSRAITNEAGCAKGILHNHFTDLDGFLAEFVMDRFRLAAQDGAKVLALAGRTTVAQNLNDAAASLFGSNALALANVVMSRPSLMLRIGERAARAETLKLPDLERVFAAYLDAEKKLGRVMAHADTEAIGLALIAAAHHLFITHRASTTEPHSQMRRIVDVLVAGVTPRPPTQTSDIPAARPKGSPCPEA
jgi:AcrR family transcriptional regulator